MGKDGREMTWRKFTSILKAAGWTRLDTYYWKHPDGGRFYPWNMSDGGCDWQIWAEKGEAPPGDNVPFEAIKAVSDDSR